MIEKSLVISHHSAFVGIVVGLVYLVYIVLVAKISENIEMKVERWKIIPVTEWSDVLSPR